MLEVRNVEVAFLHRAFKASANPMRVGEVDTRWFKDKEDYNMKTIKKLASAEGASGHDNFLNGVRVFFDIKYPQYWTIEAERYHWFDIVSSQSKMHRLHVMLSTDEPVFNKYVDKRVITILEEKITNYNDFLVTYAGLDNDSVKDERYRLFMECVSNIPLGFEMWMSVSTNYLQLKTMYNQRKTHKLKEDWGEFCSMCEQLPMFLELIKGE